MTDSLGGARGELKRGSICRAALSLFAEKGFYGTTVPDIVRRGRIALGTFYSYFESKDELVNQIYRDCRERLNVHLLEADDSAAPQRDRFHQMWRALLSFAQEYGQAMMFLLQFHTPYLTETSLELDEVPAPLVVLIKDLSPHIKPLSARLLGLVVWGIFVETLREHSRSGRSLSAKVVDQIEQCAWDAIEQRGPGVVAGVTRHRA